MPIGFSQRNAPNISDADEIYLYLELFNFLQIFSFYSVTQALSHTVSCFETFTFSFAKPIGQSKALFLLGNNKLFFLFSYLIDIMKGACGFAIVRLENFYSLHRTKKFEKNVPN